MSTLQEYLVQKREAGIALRENARKNPQPTKLHARVKASGRSGIREIRIRNFQVISDSQPNYAGYDLGPSSPELQLGALGSCLTHITLIQAAQRGIKLDALEVEVTGEQHPLAGEEGFEHIPIYPHNIQYKIHIVSKESPETIKALHEAVERVCPLYNLLVNPQKIVGEVVHRTE